jgi:hypothetical protein
MEVIGVYMTNDRIKKVESIYFLFNDIIPFTPPKCLVLFYKSFFTINYFNSSKDLDDNLRSILINREKLFFKECIEVCRTADPAQPLTIGFMMPSWPELDDLCRLLDVLSFHPYAGWWDVEFEETLNRELAYAQKINKALICTETCQGSLDDSARESCIRSTFGCLNKYSLGWYGWTLCAGQMVSMRRDRTDTNAKPGDRGYMCFFNRDGSLRPGHDAIKKYI